MRLLLILASTLLVASSTRSDQSANHGNETEVEEDASASNSSRYSTGEMRDMCLKEWGGKTEEVQQYFDQLPSEEFKENSEDLKFQQYYEQKGIWEDSASVINITSPPPRHLPGPEYTIEVNDSYVPKYRVTSSEEKRMYEDGTFNSPSSESSESKEKRTKTPGKKKLVVKKKKKGKKRWPENMDPISDGVMKKKKKKLDGEKKKKKKTDTGKADSSVEDKKKRKSDTGDVEADKRKKKKKKELDSEHSDSDPPSDIKTKKKKKKNELDSEHSDSDPPSDIKTKKKKKKKSDSDDDLEREKIKKKKNSSESGNNDSGPSSGKKKKRSDPVKAKKSTADKKQIRNTDNDRKKRKDKVEKELSGMNGPKVKISKIGKQIKQNIKFDKKVNLPKNISPLSKEGKSVNKDSQGQTHNIDLVSNKESDQLNKRIVENSQTKELNVKNNIKSLSEDVEKQDDSKFNKLKPISKLTDKRKRQRKSQTAQYQPRPYLY